ncbi:MAG: hypothetical protein JJ855_04240 [Rhodospirillales bacterium]|nr:hypothetical protein [Rhodospirillales bacterium]
MPNDMPAWNMLTSLETRIVLTMRQFLDQDRDGRVPEPPDAMTAAIGPPLSRLIGLLWCADPHAVDLNHRWDPDVSTFEVQVLYAISEARAEQTETVEELLSWWYPAELVELARHSLYAIARTLERIGARPQSSARLREHILSISSRRRKPSTTFAFDDGKFSREDGDTDTRTIH